MKTTIEFEDHGQDFLTWICDDNGIVVESIPFQTWVWSGMEVIAPLELRPGDVVDFKDHAGKLKSIRYPIHKITHST